MAQGKFCFTIIYFFQRPEGRVTKLPIQIRRGRQRRCWCDTGECWAVECATSCKHIARTSTCLAIIQAMSHCPGYFPRLLLWVVLPHSMDGRSQCPPTCCAGSMGSQGGGNAQCRTMEGCWAASSLPGCWDRS